MENSHAKIFRMSEELMEVEDEESSKERKKEKTKLTADDGT